MIGNKFNIVFSNPPYTKNLDLKILEKLVLLADELVVVHPAVWLIDNILARNVSIRKLLQNNLKEIELINGSKVFNINIWVPVSITHIVKDFLPDIRVTNNVNDGIFKCDNYRVKDIFDITIFGNKFVNLVKPFIEKIKLLSNNLENMKSKAGPIIFKTGFFGGQTNNETIVDNSFLGFVFYDKHQIGLSDRPDKPTWHTWSFKNEMECNNFIKYCRTKFARFCFAYYKKNSHICGALKIIPWLDFTQEWTDEKLFKYFEISDKLQKYIEDFIPNCYKEDYDK